MIEELNSFLSRFNEFWELVKEVWAQGFLGADVGTVITAVGVFALFLFFRHLFARIVINQLERLTRRSTTRIDDEVIEALDGPLRFVPVVAGLFFASETLQLAPEYAEIAGKLMRSLIAYTIFWALFAILRPISSTFGKLVDMLGPATVDWITKALKAVIFFIGAAAILEIWGIEVGPLLAGLGLLGVAVALGAQDLFKNLIAGLMILAEKRFSIGEWILVEGIVEGTVEEIGFRSTRVRRFDKAPVFVPNAQLSDEVVTNFTRMTFRRIKWVIGVEYRTTIDQLREIRDGIEDYILNSDEFVKPSEASTFVRIDSFNNSSIDILLYCFTRTTVWGEWLEIKERLAVTVKEIVEDSGTGFAFPSRSLYVETLPGEAPEVYVPPGSGDDGGAGDGNGDAPAEAGAAER